MDVPYLRRAAARAVGPLAGLALLFSLAGPVDEPPPDSTSPPEFVRLYDSSGAPVVPGQANVRLRPDLAERIRSDTLTPQQALQRATAAFDRLDDSLRIREIRPVVPRIESDSGRAARILDDLFIMEFRHGADPERVARTIDSIDWIEKARPNQAFASLRPEGGAELLTERNRAVTQMGVPAAHEVTRGDTTIRIGVIDTGLDTAGTGSHLTVRNGQNVVDVDTAAWKERGYTLARSENYTRPGHLAGDRSGHGTMMVRAIAGRDGMCPNCSIIPLRAGFLARFPVDGNERTVSRFEADDIAAALVWATDQNADVINLSIAMPEASRSLALGINYAYRRGVLLVAAAGNQGRDTIPYPAAYGHVMAVGASDETGQRARFSNYGSALELTAPGVDVRPDAHAYHVVRGTSLSAAYVSGVAGLVHSLLPTASGQQIRTVLKQSARMPPLLEQERSPKLGFGVLRADEAVRQALRLRPSGDPQNRR